MLKHFSALLLHIAVTGTAFSQGFLPAGARARSMGNAVVAIADSWAYFHNPGALARVKQVSFGISYENRFLLKELQSQAGTYVQPLKKGVLSIGIQRFGYKSFVATKAGAGYSLQLAEKIDAGIQLNYQGLRLTDYYGSKNTVTAEAGILASISPKWNVGISVFNIGRAKLADYTDERFSTCFRIGTQYKISEQLLFVAEGQKELNYTLRVKAGLEYELKEHFFFRFGLQTEPVELAFGFGYKLKLIQLDFGSAYDQRLGWSPHFSLTCKLNEKHD